MKPNSPGDKAIPSEKRDTLRAPYTVNNPSVSEHAMLDLAVHLSTSAGDRVVSAHHQLVAFRYVRRFGWLAAVDRVIDARLNRGTP